MSPAILHASWSFLARLAEPAARSLVVGSLAGLALTAMRVKSVGVKIAVWRGVLVAALAMPLVVIVAPPLRVLIPVPSFGTTGARAAAQSVEPAAGGLPRDWSTIATPGNALAPTQASVRTPGPDSQSQNPVRRMRQYPWPVFLLATYLAVVFMLLVRFFVGLRFGQQLERSATPIEDSAAVRALSAGARRTGVIALPVLAECKAISVPLTLGVRKPVILLPAEWRGWQTEEREAVLAHEVSHVARHDAVVQRLALIHRAIFWFSPLSWWLERHLADLAEQASDEAALAVGVDRRRYAETLLGFFGGLEASPERVWWQGLSMAKAGQAEERVDRILAWRGEMPNKVKKSLLVALLAAAVPVVALTATVHTSMYTEYDDQEPAKPQAPPAPAVPQPSANPVVNPGPTPEAPNATPAAPPTPAVAPTPAPPEAAPVLATADPTYATVTSKEAKETLRRAQEALKKADQALSMAKSQFSATATEKQLEAYNEAEAAYATALSKYEADLQHLEMLAQEKDQTRDPRDPFAYASVYGDYLRSGPRFVIVSKDSVTMSGSEEDGEHAEALRSKIPGDFIWFERDEKSYIIRDQATVDRAKSLWKPQEELGRKQEELGKQQEALGKQQEELGEKMEKVRVRIPDMAAQLQKLEAEMKQLSANGGTMEQIGDLQSEIGGLQSRVGEIQSDAGRQQGEIGRQQGELGRKQGELGRQQGELGRQQGELARQASRQMKHLLDEAIAKGVAQPEESQR